MKTLRDFNFKGKRVLLRCDFNVPLDEKGNILDDFRIRKTIPTIEYLVKKGGKIILISHLGRPEGKFVKKFSLKPVALRLRKLLKRRVHPVKSSEAGAKQFNRVKFLPDCLGKKVEKEIKKMKAGDVVLLENLRFYKEEEKFAEASLHLTPRPALRGSANDENFARKLSRLADIFINDAFSVCHRSHASVVGIIKYLPSGAGFLLEKEIKILSQIIRKPKRPLVVIIGGKKVGDKAKVVENFSRMADFILTGGLVAEEIRKGKIKIKSPKEISFPANGEDGLDIGPKTIKIFRDKIKKARTIFWAGPLGKIEEKKYRKGTRAIARAIIGSRAFSVVGGGDTMEFLNKTKLAEKFNHVSIGGGAMLDFLAGEKMPGLEALKYGNKKP